MHSLIFKNMLRAVSNDLNKIEAGTNGPYMDEDTDIRNLAHFLCAVSLSYREEPTSEKIIIAETLLDIILQKLRAVNGNYKSRQSSSKDLSNGLMGPAWIIEALTEASISFDFAKAKELALELALLHPFDWVNGIWCRVEPDGTILSPDVTFNHQLWFASVLSKLGIPELDVQVVRFMERNLDKVMLYDDGIIYHLSLLGSVLGFSRYGIKRLAAQVKRLLLTKYEMSKLRSKSVGYHGFNLYALVRLHEETRSEKFWTSDSFKKILSVLDNDRIEVELKESVYGLKYNLSGIEFAYAAEKLLKNKALTRKWLDVQSEFSYDRNSQLYIRNTSDVSTAIARNYELLRLSTNVLKESWEKIE